MLRGSPRGPPKLSSQSPRCACQSHPEEPLAGPESTQVGGSLWGSPAEAWQVPGPGIVRPVPPPGHGGAGCPRPLHRRLSQGLQTAPRGRSVACWAVPGRPGRSLLPEPSV